MDRDEAAVAGGLLHETPDVAKVCLLPWAVGSRVGHPDFEAGIPARNDLADFVKLLEWDRSAHECRVVGVVHKAPASVLSLLGLEGSCDRSRWIAEREV